MRWSERQRALLAAMGVRLWEREPSAGVGAGGDVAEVASGGVAVLGGERPDIRAGIADVGVTGMGTAAPAPGFAPALPAADWLVVGEPLLDAAAPAPSAPAQLLDNMLRAVGVSREASTRAARAAFLPLAERSAAPRAADDDAERRTSVRAAIEATQPKCILALGRGAAQLLIGGDEPLGALRGRRHASAGVAVVVTCSLAFLLRHADEKARVWADLCLAVQAVDEAAGLPG